MLNIVNFYEIVINLDNNYENNGIAVEPYNIYIELISKYGENYKDIIKEAIEEYYLVFLDWYEEGEQ